MISPDNYTFITRWLQDAAGLTYNEEKAYLLEHRLKVLAIRNGCATVDDLISKLRTDEIDISDSATDIINALVTNETYFFRDVKLYTELDRWIEERYRQTRSSVQIWSNGCSTGQEPYSIAMLAEEIKERTGMSIPYNILATDISTRVLDYAREGVYNHFESQRGLSITRLMKWFNQVETTSNALTKSWKIDSRLRSHITFDKQNIFHPDEAETDHQFDVILLRNVLIYFDIEDRKTIVKMMTNQLKPGGIIVLGGSETMLPFKESIQVMSDYNYLYKANEPGSNAAQSNNSSKSKKPFKKMSDEEVQGMLKGIKWPKFE